MPRKKKQEPFALCIHYDWEKEFDIATPVESFRLTVDYDDVDHETVDLAAEWVVKILSEHWVSSGAAKAIADFKPSWEDD